jgi:outer membrane protein TolC
MRNPWSVLLLLAAWPLGQAGAETLNFKQCTEAALSQNPDMAISQAQIEQAEAAVREAKGNRMPRLNLSLTASRTDDALNVFGAKLTQRRVLATDMQDPTLNNPGAINNFSSRIELQIPVYNGGRVESYVRQAQALTRAAQSGDRMARQKLVKQVLLAYQGVHTARAYIKVAREGRAAAEEYVRITERLHKQGMAVKSDSLSARVNLEDMRIKLIEARNAEATALDQLKLLMGRPLGAQMDVADPVSPALMTGDAAALRKQATEAHPGLRALREQVDAARAAVDAVRAGKRPQFNVSLRQEWNDRTLGFDSNAYMMAGVLTWNAFDGGTLQAGVDRAEAQRSELTAKLRQSEEGIGFQVTDAQRRALEAEERTAVRQLSVEQAEEARRLVKMRYENGVAPLIELLSAQAQLDKTRADLVAARYDLAVTRAELKLAVGVLEPDQI